MEKEKLKQQAEEFLKKIIFFFKSGEYKKHKVVFFTSLALITFVWLGSGLFKPEQKPQSEYRELLEPTIKGSGYIADLDIVMKENDTLRRQVKKIWSYQRNELFFDYPKINNEIVEIIFRWSGLDDKQLAEMKTGEAVEYFLRRAYGMSQDEIFKNNPRLGKNPWPRMFNRYKVRLLMQGAGKEIYDNYAVYNTQRDQMEIEGDLSKGFIREFETFVSARPDRDKYVNNLISFINNTKLSLIHI